MTFGGDGEGYRAAAAACPGCAEAMSVERLVSAEVDVCGACGGIWIDWFDGDVAAITAEFVERHAPPVVSVSARESGACPRCRRLLVLERFRASTIAEDVLRCEECAGVFVCRSTAEVLARLDDAPNSEPPPGVQPLAWSALVRLLRRFVGI